MVYAYDQWAQMPVKDLYDTQIMLAAVNAAKDMYEKGEQAIKDFRKDYGDFMSPFAYDTKWYNENFNVANKLGEIYGRGGDPLRNQADRAEIYRWINSRPYADYNNKKLRAANYQTYKENMGKLQAQGLYDPDQEAFDLLRRYGRSDDPSTWNLDAMGISNWDRLSPVQAKSLKDATDEWFDKRTAHLLTKDQVASFGDNYAKAYDPRYDYTGYTDDDLMNVAGENIPGWRGTFYADYFRDRAKRQLQQQGITNPTDAQINARLQRDIADANQEYLINPQRTENKFALQAQKFADDIKLEGIKHANAVRLKQTPAADRSGNGSEKPFTSYGQTLFLRGVQNYSGSMDPGVRGINIANDFGNQVKDLPLNQKIGAFQSKYTMTGAESPQMFVSRFSSVPSRVKDVTANGINIDTTYDLNKLYSPEEVTSSTLGFPGMIIPTNRNYIKSLVDNTKENVEMHTTGNVYTAPMKNGSHEQFVELDISGNTYYYKVFESEPVPVSVDINSALPNSGLPWDNTQQETPFAPYGYSLTPSQNTSNQWGATDNYMNKAAGLASDQVHAGGSSYIDIIP